MHMESDKKRKWIYSILVAMMIAPLLAGCGKKGSPVPPPGEKSDYPRTYPSQ